VIFLVLWNTKKTKRVFYILLVPALCVAAAVVVMQYNFAVRKIPTVSEVTDHVYRYDPFRENNPFAKLDADSTLTITENLPVLDGATALYPVYASFVQAVYSEREFLAREDLVLCSQTPEAYKNLLNGSVDIIFCAEPSRAQVKQFSDNNIKLKMVPIGKEAFVFFVNKENPVNNMSVEAIKGIYSGEIKNWKELNGSNRQIRAFQRPENSGSQTMLEKIMGNRIIQKSPRENVASGMGDIINQVAVYRNFSNAIGYSFLFYATEMVKNNNIKLLSIDGIYPSAETIQNNSYPFSDNFYAIYRDAGAKNENIEPFVEWILSEQGQELIAKTGYIPINGRASP
jgi:phosphate transport system substrate-binding protein